MTALMTKARLVYSISNHCFSSSLSQNQLQSFVLESFNFSLSFSEFLSCSSHLESPYVFLRHSFLFLLTITRQTSSPIRVLSHNATTPKFQHPNAKHTILKGQQVNNWCLGLKNFGALTPRWSTVCQLVVPQCQLF